MSVKKETYAQYRARLLAFKKAMQPKKRKNPTKLQKAVKAAASRKKSGLIKAVKNLLQKANPSALVSGARVVKLKGGGLTIRPIKANRAKGRKR